MPRRKPKTPVTRLPHRNVVLVCSAARYIKRNLEGSPDNIIRGRRTIAEATLLHHASSMVELLQYGRELLMRTACTAMKRDERTP